MEELKFSDLNNKPKTAEELAQEFDDNLEQYSRDFLDNLEKQRAERESNEKKPE